MVDIIKCSFRLASSTFVLKISAWNLNLCMMNTNLEFRPTLLPVNVTDVYNNSFVRDYVVWSDIIPPSCKPTLG
jgi:hypothetical protein